VGNIGKQHISIEICPIQVIDLVIGFLLVKQGKKKELQIRNSKTIEYPKFVMNK